MKDLEKTYLMVQYSCIPWFDRGIWYAIGPDRVWLYMDDKKGNKQQWHFATYFGTGNIVAEPGHEEETEWYKNKMAKWIETHQGQKLWCKFFFSQSEYFWAVEKPDQADCEENIFI
jgi:hypothetical protein